MNSRALPAPQTFYNVHSDRWLVPMACMAQEAKFLVPDCGDIVPPTGMGLSYRPARLHRLAGRYDNPMPESTISPQSGTKNLAPVSVGKVPSCNSCKFCHGVWAPAQQSRGSLLYFVFTLYFRVQKRGDYTVPSLNTGGLTCTWWTNHGVGRKCF